MQMLSPAQCFGYAAFALGVVAFLQRNDRRLKLLNASQCLVYTLHFMLLGNPPAAASSLVSGVRSLLALKTRSPWVAALILVIGIVVGWIFVDGGYGWLPVIASSVATVAVFLLSGIPLRLALLVGTLCWLANNLLCGSIGGSLLELTAAIVNGTTILRMVRERRHRPSR
ncbi:MAG: YgjV family protein [Telmatospirillum sp.]|nr:YgjV family protein [Telmatospirillum sp.]